MMKIQVGIRNVIIMIALAASHVSFAFEFPFYIENRTAGYCNADLVNGTVVNTRAKPLSTVGVFSLDPSILAGSYGIMEVYVGGHDDGEITFQYDVMFEKPAETKLLKVTYKTTDINHPVIRAIPSSLQFYYDPSIGYVLACRE